MDLLKRYSLYAAVYLFAGAAVLFTHYFQWSPYAPTRLDEKITNVAASHMSMSQLVDHLPAIFRENPHAAALKISDLRGSFLGAMYDSRRMASAEYRQFLDTKLFDPDKQILPGYKLHIWESKRRKLRIVALSLERAQFSEYLATMSRDNLLHFVIPLYILAGCLILMGVHYFTSGKKTVSGRRSHRKPTSPKPIQSTAPRAFTPEPKSNAWRLRSGAVAEGSIRSTLAKLRTTAGADSVSLFALEYDSRKPVWRGVMELRGALVVRGEAMDCPPELEDAAGSEDIQKSLDGKHCYLFNTEREKARICFALGFAAEEMFPTTAALQQIQQFVRENSRSLLIEHDYESSILDTETGLYSAPYAHFSLKEKLLAGQIFSTALLQFEDAEFEGPGLQKLVRSAIRILRENYTAENAPLISRGNGPNIIVIFNPGKTGADVKAAQVAVTKLHAAYANTGKRVGTAFIADTAACLTAERVIKILSLLAVQSRSSNKPESYKPTIQQNII
jgi:hypothetical protein